MKKNAKLTLKEFKNACRDLKKNSFTEKVRTAWDVLTGKIYIIKFPEENGK